MGAAGPLGVTVVGAGLAGSLAALYLGRQGHHVEVRERRPDPRLGVSEHGRSINLGVSARGMTALREVGLLDAVLEHAVPMRGRVVHRRGAEPTFHAYGLAEHEVLHSVLRHDLNTRLIEAADALDTVTFRFGSRLTSLDADGGVCWFADVVDGSEHSVKADLVVGADGAFSAVREHLVRGHRVDYQQEFLDWGYKELTIPANPDGSPRVELEALHVWPSDSGLMVAHPNHDGSLTCTLFMPFEGPVSFATVDSPEAVRACFAEHFPDAVAVMPRLAEEFMANPTGSMVTIRTSAWRHRDKVVLVGDACHAVYPFYGQGMNAAFEDCTVLDAALRRALAAPGDTPDGRPDIGAALAEYEQQRRRHTDVLADLAKENFLELRDRVRSPLFLARKKADLLLHRVLGDAWQPLYTMVSHTRTPYADALARARRQDRVLNRAAAALGVAAVAGAAALRRRARS